MFELVTDSFFKILIPGITVTVPLTVLSFALALIIACSMALVQFFDIKIFCRALGNK